jgi:hypothetical protein
MRANEGWQRIPSLVRFCIEPCLQATPCMYDRLLTADGAEASLASADGTFADAAGCAKMIVAAAAISAPATAGSASLPLWSASPMNALLWRCSPCCVSSLGILQEIPLIRQSLSVRVRPCHPSRSQFSDIEYIVQLSTRHLMFSRQPCSSGTQLWLQRQEKPPVLAVTHMQRQGAHILFQHAELASLVVDSLT